MTNQRPFRFGVLGSNTQSHEEWITRVRQIEDLGYATLLMGDHIELGVLPASVGLMAAAEATSTLRIGSYVFNNDFRHPILLAKEVAALDQLSGGRFDFGLGAGWMSSEYEQMGIPFEAPGIRVSRFEEGLGIIKKYFTSDCVTFSGKYYTISNLKSVTKPLQQPHPPIMVGGAGKRMLSIAGREANIVALALTNLPNGGWNMSEATSAGMQQKLDWVRQAAHNRFDELELNVLVYVVIVTNERQAEAQRVARFFGVSGEELLEMPFFLIGTVDQICNDLLLRRERYGISYTVVLNEHMQSFAPIVERLAGR